MVEVIDWASKVTGVNVSYGKGKKVLDVGCAYGFSSEILANFGYETYSFDLSKWGIKQAKKNSNTEFLVCDAQTAFPFVADFFDLVTCFDVLEHLMFPEKTIRAMLDVCKGVMVFTTPNRLVEKPVRRITRDFDETHVSVRSPGEWRRTMKQFADARLVKVESFFDVTAKLNSEILFKSLKLPALGLTVRVLVRK